MLHQSGCDPGSNPTQSPEPLNNQSSDDKVSNSLNSNIGLDVHNFFLDGNDWDDDFNGLYPLFNDEYFYDDYCTEVQQRRKASDVLGAAAAASDIQMPSQPRTAPQRLSNSQPTPIAQTHECSVDSPLQVEYAGFEMNESTEILEASRHTQALSRSNAISETGPQFHDRETPVSVCFDQFQ